MIHQPGLTRRHFCGAAATVAAGAVSLPAFARQDDMSIRPFKIVAFPDADLMELRKRIKATKWPDKETVQDHAQGVPLATSKKVADYWATTYNWRKCEAKLAALPNFMTKIDGLDIHFIHVKSKHENAMPMILTHGWPGSIIEFLKVIEPFTNPDNPADAFHVVIPSMPGYGFSGKPTTPGWGPERIARAWAELMSRLKYTQYVAQGGDWGAVIVDLMGVQAPRGLLGIHTNMPGVVPPEVDKMALTGAPPPAGLSDEERAAYDRLVDTYQHVAYGAQMGSRPQSITAIADSPIGTATWMLDHDPRSMALIARGFDGNPGGLTPDDFLDNVTLFWLTNTGISAARLYWENKLSYVASKGVLIPAAATQFPDEIVLTPKTWAEKAYPKLIYYNKAPKGGHFAAWEQPQIFSEEVRAGFMPLREQMPKRPGAK